MPSENAIHTTVKRLPTWVLSILAIALMSYVFALTAVAILTERDVTFMPPTIGPGPKQAIAHELRDLKNELRLLRSDFSAKIDGINKNIADARKQAVLSRKSDSVSVYLKWDDAVSEFEKDREAIRSEYIDRIDGLSKKIDSIEYTLKDHLMI